MTRRNTSLRNATVSASQALAIETLLAGESVTQAAAVAGVDRATVHRWLKDDCAFQAEWNRERLALRERMTARLTRLAEKAVDCIEMAVGNDPKTALAVLKGIGLLSGQSPPIGSADLTDLEKEARERDFMRWIG